MQAYETSHAQTAAAERPLTRSDYKTLGLAALGGALEFYDFIIFVFFAPAIGQLFFPHDIPDWLRQLQTSASSRPAIWRARSAASSWRTSATWSGASGCSR